MAILDSDQPTQQEAIALTRAEAEAALDMVALLYRAMRTSLDQRTIGEIDNRLTDYIGAHRPQIVRDRFNEVSAVARRGS